MFSSEDLPGGFRMKMMNIYGVWIYEKKNYAFLNINN